MKSGTTSLFHWLGQHPRVRMPREKEPSFFARDDRWRLGLEWYKGLFQGVPEACLSGEASVIYTHPDFSALVASRISSTLPGVRLILVVRDPIARLRSHYIHRIQKRDESRTLDAALEDPHNEYVKRSQYFSCLAPYTKHFDASRICVVRTEDFAGEQEGGWDQILRFLNLAPMSKPATPHNAAVNKVYFGRTAKWLASSGLLSYSSSVPGPVRRMAKSVLTRSEGTAYLTRSAGAPMPPWVMEALRADHHNMCAWLCREEPLWRSIEC